MNWLDLALLGLVGLSALIGLWRGFVVEVMSLAVWVAAFWLAFAFGDDAAGLFESTVQAAGARLFPMCGILGIVGTADVAAQLYDGLTVLQHRGQDAAGIATANGTQMRVHKGNGLVRDAFDPKAMALLQGRVGIGHCRYPTAGSEGSDEAQPFYVNSPFGIALAHNGNLINTDTLRREVFEQDRRNVNTESDSEVLLNVFAHELDMQRVLTPDAAFRAVEGVVRRAKGGYAVVAVVLGLGLVAFPRPATASVRWCWAVAIPMPAANSRSRPNRSRWTCSVSSACATSRRAKPSSSPRAANCIRANAPTANCARAFSNSCISRGPTR
jgi:hypothetical protein